MTARIHYNQRSPTAVAATSSDGNFPVANINTTPVDRQWRSTSTVLQNIDIDLGSSLPITAVCVQHTNAPAFTVLADNSNPPTTARGTLTTYADNGGRRKGKLEFSATVRYIRLQVAASVAVAEENGTALGYYYIGAAYVFANTLNLPRDPSYGSPINHNAAQETIELPNGQAIAVALGPVYSTMELGFTVGSSADIERVRRLAALAPVWLDLDVASERWRQWPVRCTADRVTRNVARINGERVEIPLREIA